MTDTQAIAAATSLVIAPIAFLALRWRTAINNLPPWKRYDEHIAKCRECRAKRTCHWGAFLFERARESDHD